MVPQETSPPRSRSSCLHWIHARTLRSSGMKCLPKFPPNGETNASVCSKTFCEPLFILLLTHIMVTCYTVFTGFVCFYILNIVFYKWKIWHIYIYICFMFESILNWQEWCLRFRGEDQHRSWRGCCWRQWLCWGRSGCEYVEEGGGRALRLELLCEESTWMVPGFSWAHKLIFQGRGSQWGRKKSQNFGGEKADLPLIISVTVTSSYTHRSLG